MWCGVVCTGREALVPESGYRRDSERTVLRGIILDGAGARAACVVARYTGHIDGYEFHAHVTRRIRTHQRFVFEQIVEADGFGYLSL